MVHSPKQICRLFEKTALSLCVDTWPQFLRTAAWNYKYDFPSQVLIFAQRPNATACAPEQIWTDRFQRTPNQDAAIALRTKQGNIRYVYDIADTTACVNAKAPTVPLWAVTDAQEPLIRRSLINSFLPHHEQIQALQSAPAPAFYRVIANSIVQTQCQSAIQELNSVRHTCSLRHLDPEEAKSAFRGVLAESLAAMLQYRCSLPMDLFTPSLTSLKQFDSLPAISLLGTTLQKIAYQALQTIANSVKHQDPTQTPIPPSNLDQGAVAPSETEQCQSVLQISQEDIDRAFIEGPPLPGGKYRIYQAAIDPTTSIEALSAILYAEYGTGSRPFLSGCGLHGNITWGVNGLKFALNDLAEGNHLALPWKTASGRVKSLVDANLYLSQSDKVNITAYFSSQKALEARQKAGAALTVFFAGYEPDRQSLHHTNERIRAYVYENSQSARQELLTQLHALMAQEHIKHNPDAQELACTILADLKSATESVHDHHSLHPAGEGEWAHPADTCIEPEITEAFSPRPGTPIAKQPVRSPEPLIDHPELRRVDPSQLTRSDKAALTNLLLHFVTYRSTFCRFSPTLSEADHICRENEFARVDNMLVSVNVEENLKNIQTAKQIISRWFLPFDGVRPEILTQQDKLISDAEMVLQNPPEQDQEPAHAHRYVHEHDYMHRHTEPLAPQGVDELCVNSLFDFASELTDATPRKPSSLAEQIEQAQSRIPSRSFRDKTKESLQRA